MLLAFLPASAAATSRPSCPPPACSFRSGSGTALAIQAGIGNFGVSVVQFVTPGSSACPWRRAAGRGPDLPRRQGETAPMWLQNATAIYIPLIPLGVAVAWIFLRSVPVRANFREQLDIFRAKHGLNMTRALHHDLRFFSGLPAMFPLLIKQFYGALPGAPDPLDLRLPRPARRLDRARRRRTVGPLRRRQGHPVGGHWDACLRARRTFFTRRPRWPSSPVSSARCSACSSSPASAMPRPSSRCRCSSRRARRPA